MTRPGDLDFDERLQRLVREPAADERLWTKITRPWFRLFKYQARVDTTRIGAFVRAVVQSPPRGDLEELGRAAEEEFAENLGSLERARDVHGHVDPKLVNWALRLFGVLERAERFRADLSHPGRGRATRLEAEKRAILSRTERALSELAPRPGLSARDVARVDGIEALLQAADEERDFLGRRRHLLEAARELLLDAAAKVTNAKDIAPRLEQVAREVGELDRLQAAGIRDDVALGHQLQAAWTEGATGRVNAILGTLEQQALRVGDARVAELSQAGLAQLWRGEDRFSDEHRATSLGRSGRETFQHELLEAARSGFELARKRYEIERMDEGRLKFTEHFDRVAKGFLERAPETELIHAALYVDGCVDVGGVLSPHRVEEPLRILREVTTPTQKLTLGTARGIEDVQSAIIADPRTLLADLASERLFTRRYLGLETRYRERRVMASEVRIFLLDGSGSMLGPRARMRDAIIVAELSTMIARLNDKDRWLTPILYYRYFNEELGEVHRVQSAADAIEAVTQVLGRLRHGGTDIQGALLGSFETLREAKANSEDELARAQIVLVTDGEAPVDEAAILRAREAFGGVPIGVSIIALGEENSALRALAERQRERGERVFYQFLADPMLERLAKGERSGLSLHLPESLAREPLPEALSAVIEEITVVRRARDDEALARAHDEQRGLADVGLSVRDLSRTEQARMLTLARDHEVLERRFERWFPRPVGTNDAPSAPRLLPSDTDEGQIAEVKGLLQAVAEVTEVVGSEPFRRRLDAVEMFERLLLEKRLSFVRYLTLVERYPGVFDAELAALHLALQPAQSVPSSVEQG